jgi:hypothetical protein
VGVNLNLTAADYSLMLSAWGAVIATALAALRLGEFISGRRLRLTASYLLTTNAEEGNVITIENSSSRPAMISYWELIWATRKFGRNWFERMEAYPDDGAYEVTIPPHSRHSIVFAGDRHFLFRPVLDGNRVHLYLRLYLVARKSPVTLFVR